MSDRLSVFLDIDGVFSIFALSDAEERKARVGGLLTWPAPLAVPLLRALACDLRVSPVWLSAWGDGAHAWNEYAGTPLFPIAYPLEAADEAAALRSFPAFSAATDRKLVAAAWYLRSFAPGHQAAWIEDGFPQETRDWAKRSGVRLVDTTRPEIRALLLRPEGDLAQAARAFLQTNVYEGVPHDAGMPATQ